MQKTKNNYLRGFIGAFIGALLGTIPLFVVELRYDRISFIAAIIISILAFLGYKMFKGKIKNFAGLFIMIGAVVLALLIYDFLMNAMQVYDGGIYPSIKNIFAFYREGYVKVMSLLNTLFRSVLPIVMLTVLSIIFVDPEVKGYVNGRETREIINSSRGKRVKRPVRNIEDTLEETDDIDIPRQRVQRVSYKKRENVQTEPNQETRILNEKQEYKPLYTQETAVYDKDFFKNLGE